MNSTNRILNETWQRSEKVVYANLEKEKTELILIGRYF